MPHRILVVALAVLAGILTLAGSADSAAAQKRLALVIGNSAYQHTTKLANPVNDAGDMAAALRKLGFDVIEGLDLDKATFDGKVREFAVALKDAQAGVFFYAGHGMQVASQNYLVPIDAKGEGAETLDFEMVRVDVIHRAMERQSSTNILFLDACRDNPLARNLARSMGTRSSEIGRGLAPIESGVGTLISFSTHPGAVASDGVGRNSPFSASLVRHLSTSGEDLSAILISVRNDVMSATQRKQVPWEHSALTGRFYFNLTAQAADASATSPARLSHAEAAEAWGAVKDTKSANALETFIARYGGTFYADLARGELEALNKGQPGAKSSDQPVLPPAKTASYEAISKTLPSDAKRSLDLFRDVFDKVRSDYVEPQDEKFLIETAVDGMLKTFPSGSGAEAAKLLAIMPLDRAGTGRRTSDEFFTPFGNVFQHVHRDHAKTLGGSDPIIFAALQHMLNSLDPHSAYLNPKSYRDMQTTTRGEFGGIGLEVTMENGLLTVVSPIDDTPAARAGLQANDVVTHLDGAPLVGLTLEQAVEKIRGPANTALTITVTRKGREAPFDVKIVRAVIRVNSIKVRREGDIVYIKVSTFSEQTHSNLVKSVEAIKKTMGNIKGYIVDLRSNPGGLLEQAVQVSDDFLEKGPIVLMKGRTSDSSHRANARPGDITGGKPIIVLINGGSASASEIVAGALQDHKRAVLVGTRSFGKGSVQTIIPFGANGAIRLTTARYFTPSGRSIQARGIEPDIVVEQELPDELKSSTAHVRGESSLRGHLKGDGKEGSGSSSYVPREAEKDAQLQHALKSLRSPP